MLRKWNLKPISRRRLDSILSDCITVSELMRREPDLRVLNWIRRQNISHLYLTALSVVEIRRGLALLPDGKRKLDLGPAAG